VIAIIGFKLFIIIFSFGIKETTNMNRTIIPLVYTNKIIRLSHAFNPKKYRTVLEAKQVKRIIIT